MRDSNRRSRVFDTEDMELSHRTVQAVSNVYGIMKRQWLAFILLRLQLTQPLLDFVCDFLVLKGRCLIRLLGDSSESSEPVVCSHHEKSKNSDVGVACGVRVRGLKERLKGL